MNTTAEAAVSQSEVERLLAQVGSGASLADSIAAGAAVQAAPNIVQPHEFPHLSFFSSAELRKLRLRHELFINSLAGRLSIHLGMDVSLQMSKLGTLSFQKFTDGLSNPTHLIVLKVEPLKGICLLDIPPHLGLCIVDRELGGPAVSLEEPRELSSMEARLLNRVAEMITGEWCSMWSDLHDLRAVLMHYENNGRFIQTCPSDTTMLVLSITTRVGDVSEPIQLAFPHFTLEPLMAKLNAGSAKNDKPAPVVQEKMRWNPMFNEIPIELTAELPELQVTARQIADLKPGDIIPFNPQMANQVRICVGATPKFVGSFGNSDGGWAVKISQVLQG